MPTRLRHLLIPTLLGVAAPAWADACDDALNRFDYPAAHAIARERLERTGADARAWICLARSRYETGRFTDALAALERADRLPMDGATRVLADNWFGVTLRRLDRRAEAWPRIEAALANAARSGDPGGLASALHNRAGLLYDAGRAEAALDHFRRSAAINPDAAERSASLNNMGLIEADRGNPLAAVRLMEAAIDLNRRHRHFHHRGKHLMNLGDLYRRLNRPEEAERLLAEGAELARRADDRFWIAVSHRLTAWLARDQGQWERARAELALAIRDYALAGAPLEEREARAELASLPAR